MFDEIAVSDFWEPFLSASAQIEGNGPTDRVYSIYSIALNLEAILEEV